MKIQETKARIYKQADGSIKIGGSFLNDDDTPLLASKFPWVETYECDIDEIRDVDNVQISLESGVMTIDKNWETTLMPPNQIRKSLLIKNRAIASEEVAKEVPDLNRLTRSTAILNSVKSWSDRELYVEALKLVIADGTKPGIAIKLQEKIDGLVTRQVLEIQ